MEPLSRLEGKKVILEKDSISNALRSARMKIPIRQILLARYVLVYGNKRSVFRWANGDLPSVFSPIHPNDSLIYAKSSVTVLACSPYYISLTAPDFLWEPHGFGAGILDLEGGVKTPIDSQNLDSIRIVTESICTHNALWSCRGGEGERRTS